MSLPKAAIAGLLPRLLAGQQQLARQHVIVFIVIAHSKITRAESRARRRTLLQCVTVHECVVMIVMRTMETVTAGRTVAHDINPERGSLSMHANPKSSELFKVRTV